MSLLMDTQTNRFWARVDFLATGEIVLHIPEEVELPIRVLVSRGGRSTEYEPNSSEKPNNSTISKMEQVDKDTNVRSKDEPQTSKIIEAYAKGFEDGADAVNAMPSTECIMCKHFKDRPNCVWECEYDTFEECRYEPKDEPQTDCAWK